MNLPTLHALCMYCMECSSCKCVIVYALNCRKQTDSSKGNGTSIAVSRVEFQRVLNAYEVLRDPGKRAQYDGRTSRGHPTRPYDPSDFSKRSTAGHEWPRASTSAEAWERVFSAWERRMKEEFGEFAEDSERWRREKEEAQRIARQKAWKREKMEAQYTKMRRERVRLRAEQAKAVRHATVLRQFWQTHAGITRQDCMAALAFISFGMGLAFYVRAIS